MKKTLLLFASVLLLGGATIWMNLAPDANIVVEAISHDAIEEMGLTSEPSSGLDVVGKGEIVYVRAEEESGEDIMSIAWSLAGPDGSTATMDSVGTVWNTFRTDMTGTFTVNLTITTASGTASASHTFTSANYVSVGQVDGVLFPDARQGQCAACHSGHYGEWTGTGHSTMFTEAIDGLKSSHYNESCIECHTVGFNLNPAALNGGFDDVAAQSGWTFPETLEPGNWDSIVENYPDVARHANIQCENCHGPGSEHRGDKTKIDVTMDAGMCGRCHEDGSHHVKNQQWKNSLHAVGVASAAGNTSCAGCHSSWGFVNRMDPVSNLDQKTGVPQITCAACHDPHNAGNEHQLRSVADVQLENGETITFGGLGKLCMNCHKSRRNAEEYVKSYSSHYGPHHNPQADMLAGTNAITFGRVLTNSTHRDVLSNACVDCHMSTTPAAGEPGYNELGEHTWNMSYVDENGVEVDQVGICRTCHEPDMQTFEDRMARRDEDGDGEIEPAQDEIDGLLARVGVLLPPLGSPDVEVTADYTLLQRKAAYNYLFVTEDGSRGMHNFQYAVGLLKLTEQVLQYGVLSEGTIASIADVPNDQGKQVNVTWTRFGGDGPSDNPVQIYYVWRRVDGAAAKTEPTYASIDDVPLDPSRVAGATVNIDGDVYTQVANQPAAQMEMYSSIAPTLYDSTASGTHWSVFKVSGHTTLSTVFAVTEPDSAYSVDNLVPAAPSTVMARGVQGTSIQLTWDDPVDQDFDYFAIYRSTTEGFDPSNRQPIATMTTPAFLDAGVDGTTTYFYRLAAFDFSGNRSDFSNEVTASVTTDTERLPGVPTAFALGQNYPNPFNPSTTIDFAVPETGHVKITIFDVSGKVIDVVYDATASPGRYQVTWQADKLASGVYFYRLESGSTVISKSMLLLK